MYDAKQKIRPKTTEWKMNIYVLINSFYIRPYKYAHTQTHTLHTYIYIQRQ